VHAFVVVVLVFGVLAFRYPIINHLAGWLIVFPIVTVSGGSIAWAILIQRSDAAYSLLGYAVTLAISAAPVALLVARLARQ
jgi:hypothetical protein